MPEDAQEMGPYGPSPDQLTILVQEEEWNLSQNADNPNVFAGTYLLKQRPELPAQKKRTAEHAPVNMTFSLEITLAQQKETPDKEEKSEDEEENDNGDDEDAMEDDDSEARGGEQGEKGDKGKDADEALVTEFDGLELD
jgi:hypothetical protein